MAEELIVVLKRSENSGFGFSLLGSTGPPHVIYDIIENSPAADSGAVEAGDMIIKINGIDVHKYTTKEVLKCLRLSDDMVTLELQRDMGVKARIKEQLARNKDPHYTQDVESPNSYHFKPQHQMDSLKYKCMQLKQQNEPITNQIISTSSSSSGRQIVDACRPSRIPTAFKCPTLKNVQLSPQHKKSRPSQIPTKSSNGGTNQQDTSSQQRSGSTIAEYKQNQQSTLSTSITRNRFEAFMMTGDLILNLSRTPQNSSITPRYAKKVDSLCDCSRVVDRVNKAFAPRASGETSPSSSSQSESSDSTTLLKKIDKTNISSDCSFNTYSKNNRKCRKITATNDRLLQSEELGCSVLKELYDDDEEEEDNDKFKEITVYYNQQSSDVNSTMRSKNAVVESERQMKTSSSLQQKINDDVDLINNKAALPSISTVHSRIDLVTYSTEEKHQQQHQLHYLHDSSSSSSITVKSETNSILEDTSFSVPTSPISLSTPLIDKDTANSAPTSPDCATNDSVLRRQHHHNGVVRKCDSVGFRTSKSEDHLQQVQREGIAAVIPIDIDIEDVNSSLNTLLDTRQDSEYLQALNRDRIVWTYNAPLTQHNVNNYAKTSSNSHSSSISSSPQHTDSPASPTSVSSSVMTSSGSKGAIGGGTHNPQQPSLNVNDLSYCTLNGGDQSVSEVISNISSPDYQDDDNLPSSRDHIGMTVSDPSDSDSTITISEAIKKKKDQHMLYQPKNEHKLIIQVRGFDNCNCNSLCSSYFELKNSKDELVTLTEESNITLMNDGQCSTDSSPPVCDDCSDVESLHSYHYSPKAVDMPSAIRLAKRLYSLDGFKKSDVSRHLSKNNDFSKAVADEYLKYFTFENKTLDQALREFLQTFSLSGETQERERVLVHFSKRYLVCNPGSFKSQDAVHTLTCAIMLLNTDLHGQNINRKMTCTEFIDNLAELNDGENFPKDVLKNLYQAIKSASFEWALDDAQDVQQQRNDCSTGGSVGRITQSLFMEIPNSSVAIEYKKGYVMRKCCYDFNNKKTPFGKRSWKMFFCTLRDLVLYLHKDEHGFRKNQISDNLHNAVRIHHALATNAIDYSKKQHVFRLQTADQAEYLFQTSDSKELISWVETVNFVCASLSAPPLEGGVGSQKRFQRPLLPSTHTKLIMKEQLESHERQICLLESSLDKHKLGHIPTKGLPLQNFKEKEIYLQYEIRRYKTYWSILNARLQMEIQNICPEEACDTYCEASTAKFKVIIP